MSTETSKNPDLKAIMESVIARQPVDPAVAARVQKQSEEIRKRLPETNVAVELIREARNP